MSAAIHVDKVIDAKGQMCPMPIISLKRAYKELEPGQTLAIMATDQGAKRDIPTFVENAEAVLLEMTEEGGVLTFYIRKPA